MCHALTFRLENDDDNDDDMKCHVLIESDALPFYYFLMVFKLSLRQGVFALQIHCLEVMLLSERLGFVFFFFKIFLSVVKTEVPYIRFLFQCISLSEVTLAI